MALAPCPRCGYPTSSGNLRGVCRIREALRAKGYRMVYENTTNQIFVVLDHATIDRLEREVRMGFMERYDDDHTVMRICTSWATTAESVDRLIDLL